jgi:hypothetical protein
MTEPRVQSLTQFTLAETPDGYLIEIEGDGGGALAVEASPEQLDAIIDALADLLEDGDGSASRADADDEEEEELEDGFTDDVAVDDES